MVYWLLVHNYPSTDKLPMVIDARSEICGMSKYVTTELNIWWKCADWEIITADCNLCDLTELAKLKPIKSMVWVFKCRSFSEHAGPTRLSWVAPENDPPGSGRATWMMVMRETNPSCRWVRSANVSHYISGGQEGLVRQQLWTIILLAKVMATRKDGVDVNQ